MGESIDIMCKPPHDSNYSTQRMGFKYKQIEGEYEENVDSLNKFFPINLFEQVHTAIGCDFNF